MNESKKKEQETADEEDEQVMEMNIKDVDDDEFRLPTQKDIEEESQQLHTDQYFEDELKSCCNLVLSSLCIYCPGLHQQSMNSGPAISRSSPRCLKLVETHRF